MSIRFRAAAILRTLPVVLLSLILPAISQGANVYSIQGAAYDDLSAANNRKAQLETSASPVFVHTDETSTTLPHKVFVGKFATYAEAWCYGQRLSGLLPADSFIRSWETASQADGTPNQLPVVRPFNVSDLLSRSKLSSETITAVNDSSGFVPRGSFRTSLLSKSVTSLSKSELLEVGMNVPDHTTAALVLQRFVNAYPNAPEVSKMQLARGWRLNHTRDYTSAQAAFAEAIRGSETTASALARLASAHLRIKRGQPLEAFQEFSAAASVTTLPLGARREAIRHAAACAHNLKNYPDAWLAYEAMERTAANPADVAEARMQLAALAFELAGAGKGTWEEVRSLCKRALAVPGATQKSRATAALMHAELQLNERAFDMALAEVEEILEQYQSFPQIHNTAKALRGTTLYRLGRIDEAKSVFETILTMNIPSEETFKGNEPEAQALTWLAWIAADQKNESARNSYLTQLKERYPNSSQVKTAEKMYELSDTPLSRNR